MSFNQPKQTNRSCDHIIHQHSAPFQPNPWNGSWKEALSVSPDTGTVSAPTAACFCFQSVNWSWVFSDGEARALAAEALWPSDEAPDLPTVVGFLWGMFGGLKPSVRWAMHVHTSQGEAQALPAQRRHISHPPWSVQETLIKTVGATTSCRGNNIKQLHAPLVSHTAVTPVSHWDLSWAQI